MSIAAPRARFRASCLAGLSLLVCACADRIPTSAAVAVPAGPSETSLPATSTDLGAGSLNAINTAATLLVGTGTSAKGDSALAWSTALGRRVLATLDPGGKTTTADRAHSVNDAGLIVGESTSRQGIQRAVLWSSATAQPTELGELRPGGMSMAYDVNAAGTVAGGAEGTDGIFRAFTWTALGGMRDLSAGAPSTARAINAAGTVVGSVQVNGQTRAAVWTAAGTRTVLGTLGGTLSEALDVNAAGAVVGRSRTASGEVHAFLWTAAGGMKDLGTLGGARSVATGINDAGMVVGHATTAAGRTAAFAWLPRSGMRDLGALAGGHATASGISRQGYVAGSALDGVGAARMMRWQAKEVNSLPVLTLGQPAGPFHEGDRVVFPYAWSDADQDAVSFYWTFGDGGKLSLPATLLTPPVERIYRDQGVFAVRLVATDPSGRRDTAEVTVTVLNRPPTARFAIPPYVYEGTPVVLGLNNVTDVAGDVSAGLQVSYDCGGGVFGAWQTRVYRFTCPAKPDNDTLRVAVRVRDKDGGMAEYSGALYIHNHPPLPTPPVLSATTVRRGATLTARSSRFTDRGAADGPWFYEYIWGDRTTTTGTVAAQGVLPAATHAYATAGTYTVLVRMTDKDGKRAQSTSQTVVVTP